MICRQCLLRASARARWTLPIRSISSSSALSNATPSVSTPATTAPVPSANPSTPAPLNISSCPQGTVLTGLNYFNNKQDPVALADEEYPEWLWRTLEVTQKNDEVADDAAGDEFSKSKKQRRLAAKKQRVLEAKILASGDLEALAPKIPLQHQSINLPGSPDGGAEEMQLAATKRMDLKKAMRKERKNKIKETNYLKTM